MKLNSCAEAPTSTRVSDVSLCSRSLDKGDLDLIFSSISLVSNPRLALAKLRVSG